MIDSIQSRERSKPRSSRNKRRSGTNLSDLRLAPLSTRFAEPAEEDAYAKSPRSPYEERSEAAFARQHASYIQGKSAPTTPGILSRSSSRKNLGGGLSRRGSLYEDAVEYTYSTGSGQIPKAKSEAALFVRQPHLPGHAVSRKPQTNIRSKTGTNTPRARSGPRQADDADWLSRTRATTHEILQEAKGQSWLASRDSSTSLTHLESDDDDADIDDGYEEMAALSASQARSGTALGPTSARIRSPAWGSRYGSRSGSRRTSRRGSVTSQRTPLAMTTAQPEGGDYFNCSSLVAPVQVEFDDPEEEGTQETDPEREVARLSKTGSYGVGGIVDRLMNFNLFSVSEHEEATTDDEHRANRTDDETKERHAAEAKRAYEKAERRPAVPPAPSGNDQDGDQARWQDDAAWLLSVASKAIF